LCVNGHCIVAAEDCGLRWQQIDTRPSLTLLTGLRVLQSFSTLRKK